MNYEFTLYCFAKCFDFKISKNSTSNHKLSELFCRYSVYDHVIGNTSCLPLISEIDSNQIKAQLRYIDARKLQNIYKNVINKSPTHKEDEEMMEELLCYALRIDKRIQENIYGQRNNEDFLRYLNNLQSGNISKNIGKTYNHVDSLFEDIDIENVKEVQMAFHAGSIWLDSNWNLNDFLEELLKKGIEIRVIVNDPITADLICCHCRPTTQSDINTFESAINGWQNYENLFRNLKLKISNIPMMYNYVSFIMKDEKKSPSVMRIVYYTYGNSKFKNNNFIVIGPESQYYEMYKNSFTYLWNYK